MTSVPRFFSRVTAPAAVIRVASSHLNAPATAPSIPTRKQCFGYEEGPEGELVLQRQVNHGYGGMSGADRVGPADYRPKVSFTKPAGRVVDFAKTGGHATFDVKIADAQPHPLEDHVLVDPEL